MPAGGTSGTNGQFGAPGTEGRSPAIGFALVSGRSVGDLRSGLMEVVLGLFGGVVAGFVTGWLTGRREKRAWLRDKRYELYANFLGTALDLHSVLATTMRRALREKDLKGIAELMARSRRTVSSLYDQLGALEIVAPSEVTTAAAKASLELTTTLIAAVPAQMANDEFNYDGWIATLRQDNDALADFQDAVGRDLGLSRIEMRRRRKRRASPELRKANEETVAKMVKELDTEGTLLGRPFLAEGPIEAGPTPKAEPDNPASRATPD